MHKFINSWIGKKWWAFLVVTDLVLLTATVVYPLIHNFQQKWRLITPFSLHTENNFAAWWSGIIMLLAALLAYQRSLESNKNYFAWIVLALVLAGLSLDEIGSFHERIGHLKGWYGVLPFGFILVCLMAYTNTKLFRSKQTVTNAKYLLIANSLFLSVAVQEYIEHAFTWKFWILGIRTGIEEGTELLATLFILLAVIYKKEQPLNLLSLLPQLKTILNMKLILGLGLIIHIAGCYLITEIGDPFFRGNPMNWYPTTIYFCLTLICLSKMTDSSDLPVAKKWGFLSALSLITSVGIMTNLFMITLSGIFKFIEPTIINEHFTLIYLMQLLSLIMLLGRRILDRLGATIFCLIFIIVVIWADLYIENIWLRYSMLGALSYWTFYIFTLTSIDRNKIVDLDT